MQVHILSLNTPSAPGVGSKCQNIFFSEKSHIAYQTKESGAKSTMQTYLLSLNTPSAPTVKSKSQHFFSECGHVAYQIKGKKYISTQKQTL